MARVAIVTGGSRGIGRASALELARRGFDIGITYITHSEEAERVLAAVGQLGRNAVARRLDLREPETARGVIDDLSEALGGLDVLVNNAGVKGPRGSSLNIGLEELQNVLNVNLLGPIICAQAALRRMLAAGTQGRIINITSLLDQAPQRGALAYCVSKAALDAATRVMALEFAQAGIAVNAVAPGHIATGMNGYDADTDVANVARSLIPIGRPADPREVATVVAFLAGTDASYLIGSNLLVDGGLLLVQGPTPAPLGVSVLSGRFGSRIPCVLQCLFDCK